MSIVWNFVEGMLFRMQVLTERIEVSLSRNSITGPTEKVTMKRQIFQTFEGVNWRLGTAIELYVFFLPIAVLPNFLPSVHLYPML